VIKEDGRIVVTVECQTESPVNSSPSFAVVEITQKQIESRATIINFTDGSLAEADEPLRIRLLRGIASTPQGGSYVDYIGWVESIPGVKKSWVRPAFLMNEPGKVKIALVWEKSLQAVDYTAVEELLAKLSPATALVEVVQLKEKRIAIEFSITPDTPEIRASAHAKIAEVFQEEAEPSGFLEASGRKTTGIIALSRISEAISSADGERSHRIISPIDDISVAEGEIAVYAA
jgi:uncharacterized phage protein gp47/JayE